MATQTVFLNSLAILLTALWVWSLPRKIFLSLFTPLSLPLIYPLLCLFCTFSHLIVTALICGALASTQVLYFGNKISPDLFPTLWETQYSLACWWFHGPDFLACWWFHGHDSCSDSMGVNLSKLWETVKDRESWLATVHGSRRVRQDLVTKQQQIEHNSLSSTVLFVAPDW